MFKYDLLGKYPWEEGIEPDITGEGGNYYIEERFTKRFEGGNVTKDWKVALRQGNVHIRWVITDGKYVLYEESTLESLLSTISLCVKLDQKGWLNEYKDPRH